MIRQLSLSLVTALLISSPALALSSEDLHSLKYSSEFLWKSQTATCSGSGTGIAGLIGSATSGTLVWPFATKSPSQYERIDQGWDLQTDSGGAVYAIAPGTIHKFAPNPGGFGNDYPTEQLDSPLSGAPTVWVYYGHVHILPGLDGQHVQAGQKIATTNTTDPQNGSAAPAGWLEIGFAIANTDAPVASGYDGAPTVAGQAMHDLLINATPGQGSSTGSTCACPTGTAVDLSGNTNAQKAYNFFVQQGLSPTQAAAIVGNFVQESGVNPTETNSIGAHGIAQWLGGRLTSLQNYAQQHNVPEDDLGTQLAFAWQELNTYDKGILQQVLATQDINTATFIIFAKYEVPYATSQLNTPQALKDLANRVADAKQILKQFGGGAVSGGGGGSSC